METKITPYLAAHMTASSNLFLSPSAAAKCGGTLFALLLASALSVSCAAPTSKEPSKPTFAPPRPAPSVTTATAAEAAGLVNRETASGQVGQGTGASQAGGANSNAEPIVVANPEPVAKTSTASVPVAYVSGNAVDVREFLTFWTHTDSRAARSLLENLVDGHVAMLEATRMGIRMEPEVVRAAVATQLAEMEQNLAERAPELTLDEFLRYQEDRDPARFKELLSIDIGRTMLLSRVARTWILAQEHAMVRVMIVSEEAKNALIQAELDAGRDFADLAKEHSIPGPGPQGGELFPVVRNDRTLLPSLAFQTEPGQVAGPVEEGGGYFWLKVEAHPEPLRGTWSQIRAAVEASLEERPLSRDEYVQWKIAMERSYEIDVSPFREIVGEPAN